MNKSIILAIIILVVILVLIVSIILSSTPKPKPKPKLRENFQTTCGFSPTGITRQECLDACNIKRNSGDEGCNRAVCENICDSCTKTECEWKQDQNSTNVGMRTPLAPRIKGYSGDRQIKITWVEPLSRLPITKYILVLECEDEVPRLYYPSSNVKLLEYSVFNLENEKEYKLSLFAENDSGLSVMSNTATVVPKKNMKTPILTSDTDLEKLEGIDSSLEKAKRNLVAEIDEKMLEQIGYNTEDKDYYKLIKLLNQTKPKVNLGNGNVKIRFV